MQFFDFFLKHLGREGLRLPITGIEEKRLCFSESSLLLRITFHSLAAFLCA